MKPDVAVSAVHWQPSWRIIPTRYPEVDLWNRVADPAEAAALNELEQLTNRRARQVAGEINVLRPGDTFTGCGPDAIASFCHPGIGGRFHTRRFGAYYASRTLETALSEKAYHTIRLLKDAKIPATRTDMRVIKAEIRGQLIDLRPLRKSRLDLYHPTDYSQSQVWATKAWTDGAQGVVYRSVRDEDGECVAIYSPQTILHCRKDRVLNFQWDGINSIAVFEVQEFFRFIGD
jgi:hypothetical protein